jgi:hypothetical protein
MSEVVFNPYQEMRIAALEGELAEIRERFAVEAAQRADLPLGKFKVGFCTSFGIMRGDRFARLAEVGFAIWLDARSDEDGAGVIVIEGRGEADAMERAQALFVGAVHMNPYASEGCCGSYFEWEVSADLDADFWFETGLRAPGEPICEYSKEDVDEADPAIVEDLVALFASSGVSED